ncbi:MAG: HEPN domain-containing protein [Pseudomonadota bacterium]
MKKQTLTWLELAENDLSLAGDLLQGEKRAHYAVHFCHQSIEKLLKAIIQEQINETPLRTHNFKALCK